MAVDGWIGSRWRADSHLPLDQTAAGALSTPDNWTPEARLLEALLDRGG